MFDKDVYLKRREFLKKQLGSGLIIFLGNNESAMNYPANPYHFRQDSNFLYFFGLDLPGFAGLMDIDEGKEFVFGDDFTVDDIIWMGPQPTVKELAAKTGIDNTGNFGQLKETIARDLSGSRKIHFLPPYRGENSLMLSRLLGISPDYLNNYASVDMIRAIVQQRSVKSQEEVAEVEKALDISYEMYLQAMKMARPGVYEREIVGQIEGIVGSYGSHVAFPTILTIHGETLHNHYHGNRLEKNNLLVIDSGAESPEHYASDITRTFPVGGEFTTRQREIYEIVLKSQLTAMDSIKPETSYKDIHLQVARIMVNGLKDIGLMKGEVDAAVNEGAHALFYPHGLGHMMGLDVHDMEDIGENHVGYDDKIRRSDQFGLAYLRLAKKLRPGFVFTVEPGIYFIPALIDQWKSENKFDQYINYTMVEDYRNFGGIRIEDDVVVTE
ncbi:MAG: aminopeptidase P family protein, partial [Candidatus Aminicenantes bacterium]|nr:aminopeptidase P family protein [Candidatus Aminicenantes bacterium]